MKKQNTLRVALIVVSVVLAVIFVISLIFSQTYEQTVVQDIVASQLWILIPFTIFTEAIPQWIIPHAVILALASLGANVWLVLVYTIIGSLIGSIASYEVGLRYGKHAVDSVIPQEKEDNVRRWVRRYGKGFIFLAAFLPLPFIPVIFGSLRVQRRVFLLYGMLTRIISFILLTAVIAGV